ncbi:hypothetical protein MMC06_006297 [Schaereria dolodes]|nr:hypothetical protein [Schaereria dolodes]
MCLVKIRPDAEEDVVVPSRPVTRIHPSSQGSRSSVQFVEAPPAPRLSVSQPRSSQEIQPHADSRPQGQLIVIQHRTPRTSGLSITDGSYQYGNGPVTAMRRKSQREDSYGSQGHFYRTSESFVPQRSPRQSNTSYRSTRERVIIVDDAGSRREYYR